MVANGIVVGVADGAHDRQLAGKHGPAQALVVKAREILHGAASARHHDHVDERMFRHARKRVDQISGRALALHERRARDYVDGGPTVDQRPHHVAHRVGVLPGYDPHGAGKPWERAPTSRVAQPFSAEAIDQRLTPTQQLPLAGEADLADDQVGLAGLRPEVGALNLDPNEIALARNVLQSASLLGEDLAGKNRVAVRHREPQRPAPRALRLLNLPLDHRTPDVAQRLPQSSRIRADRQHIGLHLDRVEEQGRAR